jgi:hypothetical protein
MKRPGGQTELPAVFRLAAAKVRGGSKMYIRCYSWFRQSDVGLDAIALVPTAGSRVINRRHLTGQHSDRSSEKTKIRLPLTSGRIDMHHTGNGGQLLLAQFEAELQQGEKVLWAGHPNSRKMGRNALPKLLISMTIFVVVIVYVAFFKLAQFPQFPLLPWIVLGAGMLLLAGMCALVFFGLRFYGRILDQTAYVVTDRRALILEGNPSRAIRSIGPELMGNLSLVEYPDGTGDLILERRAEHTTYLFHSIQDARAVDALLRQIVATGTKTAFPK